MAHPREFAEGLSIGIIMDGNGRWAKNRGLPRTAGHKKGAEVFSDIADYCDELGVSSVGGVKCSVVATELVGGKYLWNSDSELLVTNSAVKLAGTDHLTVEIGGICVAGGTATKIRRVEFRGSSQVPRDSQHVRSGDGRAVPGISPISGDASSLFPAASRTTS